MPAPASRERQLFLLTLGCAKNRVDSEVMLGHLARHGYRLVPDPAQAEVIVVNTCAFVADAKEESVQAILEMAQQKKEGRCQTLVVAGCLPQRYADELLKELPEVDHFVGTGAYAQVADILAADAAPRSVIPDPEYVHDAATPRINSMPRWTAYVKVAEGCDNSCAFCIIPKLRGAQRSRAAGNLVAEAEALARDGCVELNLIAQDLTAWGYDLPGRPRLAPLVRSLARVPGIRWVRLHYAYPRDFPDDLVEVIATEPHVVKYVDMPLQHISDKLLRSMRRGRDAAFVRALLAKLRSRIPDLVLRTSLIAGLPGETEHDFTLLKTFVREQRFERLGVFEYSREEGTDAATMPAQVQHRTATRRRKELMAVQQRINREQNRALLGKRLQVLVEGASEETEHLLVGRHAGQSPEIDGVTYINEGEPAPGEMVEVEVVQAADYDVVGRVVGRA